MPNRDDPDRDRSADEFDAFLSSLWNNSPTSSDPSSSAFPIRELGTTPLARQLGLSDEQTNGHWCSRCRGIWYGYTLEVQCPVCGNRKG
jgi:hypothetical protein